MALYLYIYTARLLMSVFLYVSYRQLTHERGHASPQIVSHHSLTCLFIYKFYGAAMTIKGRLHSNVCNVKRVLFLNAGMHAGRPPSHSAYLAPSARAELSGACRQGVQQPTNMQPGTFCYR